MTKLPCLAPSVSEAAHPLNIALETQSRHWREPVVDHGALEEGWFTAATLFADGAMIDDMLVYQATFVPDLDIRGRAAYLITEYSHMFAISAVPALVGSSLVPDIDASSYAVRFETRARRHGGRFVEERHPRVRFLSGRFWAVDGFECRGHVPTAFLNRPDLLDWFRSGIESHFQPLVDILHGKTGLGRNALWRLVGDSLSALFLDAGQRFGRTDQAIADALVVLKHHASPLNNRQMHYFDIVVRDDEAPERILASRTFRARGGCCRYYTTQGGSLCSTCVLKKAADRDADIVKAMRRQLGLSA